MVRRRQGNGIFVRPSVTGWVWPKKWRVAKRLNLGVLGVFVCSEREWPQGSFGRLASGHPVSEKLSVEVGLHKPGATLAWPHK